jgi:thiol-disulfide isomerase/thioredoxin
VARFGFLLALLAAAPLLLAAEDERALPFETLEGEPVLLAPAPGGEALLVHFWATWCPECDDELPLLERAAKSCAGAPLRLAVVNVADSPEEIARFRERHGLAMPVLRDPDGSVWRRFARGLPANLTWTREGRRAELGPRDAAAWERALADLGCGAPAAR